MKRFFLVAFLLAAACGSVLSQTPRPKTALVLSGGGARGLSHIGVLKVLREAQVPVDMVVGTSMGAVVGAAYAAGFSQAELESLALTTVWSEILADRSPRDELAYRRRVEDQRLASRLDIGVSREGFHAPVSTVSSGALEKLLRRISERGAQTAKSADSTRTLPLPFVSAATDLLTGELMVMDGPSLFHALRGSMAVPGVFAPLEIEGRMLVDGGLVRNLPVDLARNLGAERIIAVNVGTPLLLREEVQSAIGVAQQMINILTEQNVRTSLAELGASDLLIAPDLSGIGFLDFSLAADSIARGEAAARAALGRLAGFSVGAQAYAQWAASRERPAGEDKFTVGSVAIAGQTRANKELLERRFGVQSGQLASSAELERGLVRVLGTGDFARVDMSVVGGGKRRDVVLLPVESTLGGNRLRLGLRLQSDLRETNLFSVLGQLTVPWIDQAGAEWVSFLELGQRKRLETELHWPLGAGGRFFVAPLARFDSDSLDLYNVAGQRQQRVRTDFSVLALTGGYRIQNLGEVRLGVGQLRTSARSVIPQSTQGKVTSGRGVIAGLNIDTLDSPVFPTRGTYVDVEVTRSFSGADATTSAKGALTQAWSFGDYSLQLHGEAARADRGLSPSILGGFLRLSGTPAQSLGGETVALVRAILARKVGQMPTGLGGAIRLGGSVELGRLSNGAQGLTLRDNERAGSAFVAIDTRIGPVYLALGHTAGRGNAVYVFLGNPTR